MSKKWMTASEFAEKSTGLLGPDPLGRPRKVTTTQANYWAQKGEVTNAELVGTSRRQQYVAAEENWIAAARVVRQPGVKGAELPSDNVILEGIKSGKSIRGIARDTQCIHTTLYRYAIKRGWLQKKPQAPG